MALVSDRQQMSRAFNHENVSAEASMAPDIFEVLKSAVPTKSRQMLPKSVFR